MPERRYRDDEVRRILELATRPESEALARREPADGLTLAEIRSIAAEVGVAPEAVTNAALAIDEAERAPLRRSLGVPIEVRRTIPLPRAPTDPEWERIVAELRGTFRARGKVVAQGGLREWSNGNLQACVEPAGDGWQLRLATVKGDVAGYNAMGAGLSASALMSGVGILAGGASIGGLAVTALLAAGGAGAFLANLARIPRWRRERQAQMERIEERVRAIVRDDPKGELDP